MFRQRRRVILTNRILGPATRAIVACAEAQVPTLVAAGNPGRSIVVVANGVDTAEFYPDAAEGLRFRRDAGIPGDAVVVALVAAHRREKRHDRFLRLIERLDAAGHHVWGLMAGGGPLLDADRELARRSPCAGRLVVAGPVSDMRAVYGASDVVTLTSDDVETFPLSFLEAQACGTPVVGMDTGGVRETLVPGETGIIVGQGDEVAMAGAVASLVADADRRALMGAAARDWVESSLSLELMVSRYERVLERVAAGWRAGR